MKHIIDILQERGLVENLTSDTELYDHLKIPRKVYCGFDPTADGLHLGSFLPLRVLKWFIKCGHSVVVLLGGATASIGDPSGKNHERPLLSAEKIEENLKGIQRDICNALDISKDSKSIQFVNNYEWFNSIHVIDFLRDIGKLFRLGPMLSKEMVKTRLQTEEGLSYTEFSYQILQGFDFYHLKKQYGVSVQVGGSDQWGNIISGLEFIGKKKGGDAFGLTFPLLLGSDGKKFGKSAEGAIWLDEQKKSAYDFYQYLLSVADVDVFKMLLQLTDLPVDQIKDLEDSSTGDAYIPNTAQKLLAKEVTIAVHKLSGLQKALQITEIMKPGAAKAVDLTILSQVKGLIPTFEFTLGRDSNLLIDYLEEFKVTKSRSEARRLIKNRGLYLNQEVVTDELKEIKSEDVIDGCLLLAIGKKRKYLFIQKD